MARKCSWDRLSLRALCGGIVRRLTLQDRDMCAGLQLVLSVYHDLLIGLEAGVDESLPVADLCDCNWADCHGAVLIDHIHVGSLRTLLHDRCGNGQAIMPRIEEEPRVDEFARPQPMSLVRKVGLESYRASGLQDLIVDKTKHALAQLDRIVLTIGKNGERLLGLLLLLLNLRQIRLWECEDERNRLNLRDDHKPIGVCRMD